MKLTFNRAAAVTDSPSPSFLESVLGARWVVVQSLEGVWETILWLTWVKKVRWKHHLKLGLERENEHILRVQPSGGVLRWGNALQGVLESAVQTLGNVAGKMCEELQRSVNVQSVSR